MATPSHAPRQLTFHPPLYVPCVTLAVSKGGWVMLLLSPALQWLVSNTSTEIGPAHTLYIVSPRGLYVGTDKGGYVHTYVYGGEPPEALTYAVPSQLPKQLIGLPAL